MNRVCGLLLLVGLCLATTALAQGQARLDSARLDRTLELSEALVVGSTAHSTRLPRTESVERLSARTMLGLASATLAEQFGRIAGLRLQTTCAVCGAAELRLNGLEGPYTLVMIDSAPLVGSLGGIYGTQGLPTLLARGVEVVRGPVGAGLPAEGLGGSVNLLTRPAGGVVPQVRLLGGSWAEGSADVAVPLNTTWALYGQAASRRRPPDRNGDGFYDLVKYNRGSLALTGSPTLGQWARASVYARGYAERRTGGQMAYEPRLHRLKEAVYGEDIYVYRGEAVANIRYTSQGRWQQQTLLSGAAHYQDAAYGTMLYQGLQADVFVQHTASARLGRGRVQLGPTARYLLYDDNTPATRTENTNNLRRELMPGGYVQAELPLGPATLRPGLRYEHHPVHGSQWAPRLHGALRLAPGLLARAATGLGYRSVNVITEDHAALTGSRRLVLPQSLQPERAWTHLAELAWDTALGSVRLDLALTAWRTDFANKILADFDTDPNAIIYRNTPEQARNQGLTMQAAAVAQAWSARASATWLSYTRSLPGLERQTVPYTPSWQTQAELTYRLPGQRLEATARLEATGPQPMPLQPADDRPALSPSYALLHGQISYRPTARLTLLGQVRNLGNWLPRYAPIWRAQDPFDRGADPDRTGTFDPGYVYGPLGGRSFVLGVDYLLARR